MREFDEAIGRPAYDITAATTDKTGASTSVEDVSKQISEKSRGHGR